MLNYQFGDIVLISSLLDPQGRNPKDRPAVVLGSQVDPGGSIIVDIIAITTLIPEPLPRSFVLLPWSLPRHPRTGLNKRCAAVGFWTRSIPLAQIKHRVGFVPGRQRAEILAILTAEEGEPDSG